MLTDEDTLSCTSQLSQQHQEEFVCLDKRPAAPVLSDLAECICTDFNVF